MQIPAYDTNNTENSLADVYSSDKHGMKLLEYIENPFSKHGNSHQKIDSDEKNDVPNTAEKERPVVSKSPLKTRKETSKVTYGSPEKSPLKSPVIKSHLVSSPPSLSKAIQKNKINVRGQLPKNLEYYLPS